MKLIVTTLAALALGACSQGRSEPAPKAPAPQAAAIPADYRLPPDPGQLWIWETRRAARQWRREHPAERLCIKREPDGWSTQRCFPRPV
jgi:hypothetical protein